MSQPEMNLPESFDPKLGELVAALLDGSISDSQFAQLEDRLRDDPQARQLYLDYLQIHDELPELALYDSQYLPADAVSLAERQPETNHTASAASSWPRSMLAAALAPILLVPAALLLGIYLGNASPTRLPGAASGTTSATGLAIATSNARFANVAQARFFGELPPKLGTAPGLNRDYALLEGMVELAFPNGATAIIEGPASFRVEGDELLALDLGRCSVHAPPGAEGFQVETPEVSVVDRGTRFAVNVSQANATDVQVVEGIADVYRKDVDPLAAGKTTEVPLRLTDSDARRFSYDDLATAIPLAFDQRLYQSRLPDRIVSYEATKNEQGRILELVSLTVQRGGTAETLSVEDLIPSRVTWFHAQESHGYLIGDKVLPSPRTSFASDRSLRTGVINLGGSQSPLSSDPIMEVDEAGPDFGTPGMAVHFERPVRNGPGADVVLFELQNFANPLQGDAFHVSPLKFEQGLRSHTITTFDLTLESPETFPLADVYLQKFEQVPQSLEQLETFACEPVLQACKFHAIAVGIDLSDLGYEEGAVVDGLFFQDNLADEDYLDPILISGLPDTVSS